MNIDECFFGSVTVGERGQVVIPIEARQHFGIKPGDKLIVLRDPAVDGLMLAKLECLQSFFTEFSKKINAIAETQHEEPEA